MKKLKKIYDICPKRHIWAGISALIIILHLALRNNGSLMAALSENIIQPLHRRMAAACDYVNLSVAEILLALAVLAVLVYIVLQTVRIIRRGEKLKTLYRTVITLLSAGLAVYAGFCILWGTYYYGNDYVNKAGLDDGPVSVEQLKTVTEYFAKMANEYSYYVNRDADGCYAPDYDEILAKSPEVFKNTEELYPCLAGPAVHAKGIFHSRVMSYTDFTGFFFPFTAEANVNTDCPGCYFAATVAHELSHQRGVAREQDANFTAVLASLNYSDPDYVYSACLLAYTHLGNALYSADYEAWEEIYLSLNENILRDFARNRAYWKQFDDTVTQKVSNTVYENFLYSYDQNLGLKSYGACVDLLVNYYYETACG